jgi:hypothetical protein
MLVATNPLDRPVLLYDGDELLGLKQNRILNITVLVPANSDTRIPVSCVEQGRWHARGPGFKTARHAAYADLRRLKSEALNAKPFAPGDLQAAVWEAIADKAERLGIQSPTGAAADIYRGQEAALAELREAFPAMPGQCGAVLALGTERLALDYASQPAAFASLYPKLLDSYLLDAIEYLDQAPARHEDLAAFLSAVGSASRTRTRSVGAGDDLRLSSNRVIGSGLVGERELLQLSAFTTTPSSDATGPSPKTAATEG